MPQGRFDQTLGQDAPNRFDDLFTREDEERERRLRGSMVQTAGTNPDAAAEAHAIARRTGVPMQAVEQNLDAFRRRDHVESKPYQQIAEQTPHLAGWLEEPQHAAVAHDDLDKLGLLEWLVTAPQRAVAQGVNQVQYAQLRHASLSRELTQAEKDLLAASKLHMQAGGALGASDSWFRGAVTTSAQQLPILWGALAAGAKRGSQSAAFFGAAGALAGAAAGPAAPFTAAAGLAGGFTAGMMGGAAEFAYQLESGLAYDEMLGMPDEHGQPIDPRVAKAAAQVVGVLNAGLELGGEYLIAKTFGKAIPGLEKLRGAVTRDAVKAALRVPTVRHLLGEAVKSYGEAYLGNIAEETAQRAVTIMGQELAKYSRRVGQVEGQLEPGNVDLYQQPTVRQPAAPAVAAPVVASTTLAPADEAKFQAWYADAAKRYDLNPNPDSPEQKYDYRGAFKVNAKPDVTGHWPSDFKQAGHPNEIVGGFNTRTGERVPGTPRLGEAELVAKGWDPETAARLAAMPEPAAQNPDGSISLRVNLDGREVLLPTVTPDGRYFTGTRKEIEDLAVAEFQKTGRHLGKFATPEAADAFAQQLHQDYAAGRYARNPDGTPRTFYRTPWEVGSELVQEALGAAQSMALIVAPGPLLSFVHQTRQVKIAQQNVQWMKALSEGVKQSKTVERAPDLAQELLARATKDGPVETVYAPTDTFAQYWQKEGIDPEQMATELTGDPDAWKRAVDHHEDLAIPTARYAVKVAGTPHHSYFAEELRLRPDQMNGREAKAWEAQIKAARPPQPAAGAAVQTDLEQKLVAAGVKPDMARKVAALPAAFGATIGGSEQLDPQQVVGNVGVTRPSLGVERAVAQPQTTPGGVLQLEPVAEAAAETGPPAGEAGAQEAPPLSATFAYYGPEGARYQVQGGPAGGSGRSHVSAEQLAELGIPVPETPPDTGERLSGEQIRNRMLAERAAKLEAAGPKAEAVIARLVDADPGTEGERAAARPGAGIDPDAPIDLTNPVEAARRMRLENPRIDAEAKALGERARATRTEAPPRQRPGGSDIVVQIRQTAAELLEAYRAADAEVGERLPDRAREQPGADQGGETEGRGAGRGAEPGRLQTPGIPTIDETFERQPAEVNAARLTPEVERELRRIVDEMETFPYEERTWHWLGPTEKLTGNAAGGHANIIPGSGGASVYGDILGFSPVNTFKGKPAKEARGSRGDVIKALHKLLETKDIHNNLAEGAVRVAEHRNAGVWTDLTHDFTTLPPSWGTVAPEAFTNALSEAIDLALAPEADLLADSTAVDQEPESLEPLTGDTSFDVSEFDQTLFDDLDETEPAATPPTERSAYLSREAYEDELRATYARGLDELASSRTTPQSVPSPPVGTWMIDDRFAMLDGHEVEQLVEVDVNNLEISEDTGRARFADVARYARWLRAGLEPPPLTVLQTDRGTLKTLDHRRLLAAKALGRKTIKAWVSWSTTSDRPGNPSVGLTFELAEKGHRPMPVEAADPKNTIFSGDVPLLESLRQELNAEDVLDTGEVQPRLPGAEAVRDTEIATPEMEAPFSLTSEIAKPGKGKQRTFFQSVYHGSPHIFDAFSLHALGTGEGAQAYGWGLYFAGKRDVADWYRNKLADTTVVTVGGTEMPGRAGFNAMTAEEIVSERLGASFRHALPGYSAWGQLTSAQIVQSVQSNIQHSLELEQGRKGPIYESLLEQRRVLERWMDQGIDIKPGGRTYTVEIPEDEDFLHYDRPASKQPAKVQAALRALGFEWKEFKPKRIAGFLRWFESKEASRLWAEDIGIREALAEAHRYAMAGDQAALDAWQEKHQGYFESDLYDPTGESIYGDLQIRARRDLSHLSMKEAAKFASLQLNQHGIAGLKYLDGSSRRAGEGSYNYVVFDDKLTQIVEYDQPLGGPLTDQELQAFAADVKQRTQGLAEFDLRLNANGNIQLETVAAVRGVTGAGTAAVQALTRFADERGLTIELSLAEKGYHPVDVGKITSSKERLRAFYKRFGFVDNRGRYKDFALSVYTSMYRTPTLTAEQTIFEPQPPAPAVAVDPTETPAFHSWFKSSQVVDGNGDPLTVYHGTRRLDRFGPTIQKGRATSGPMPFFTADREIASRYAEQKADTSIGLEEQGYETWFRLRTGRTTVNLDRAWWAISPEHRQIIAQLAPRVMTDDHGEIVLGPEGHDTGTGGYDQHIKEARGNHFVALIEEWLNSANLFNDEGAFEKVLALAGAPTEAIEFHDPHKEAAGVVPVYLSIQNPLHTDRLTDAEVEALERRSRRQRAPRGGWGVDPWDKTSRDPQHWIEMLKEDRAKGANSFVWSSIPDWVTAELKALGYDGIHDTGGKMGGAAHDVWIPFEPGQVKSAIGNRGTYNPRSSNLLYQGEEEGAPAEPRGRRGSIRFGPGQQIEISLFERANPSTLFHEFGHLFYQRMQDLVERPEASERLKGMVATLDAWFAENNATTETEKHELFARSFEQYTLDGKAPSLGLREVFSAFRAWMLGVYRSLRGLNVPLTDEVRGVFDRMLATDDAIEQAKQQGEVAPLFLTAEAMGMSPAAFQLYAATVADAGRTERERLQTKLLAEVRREQESRWREERDDIRQKVAAEVNGQPVYQALAAIRRGTKPDGSPLVEGVLEAEPLSLSRKIIADRYGKERLATLPPFLSRRDGGLDPDTVAERFGFTSGDALLNAIVEAPPAKQLIEQETERRMQAEHGNILLDGTLLEEAQAAVANEDRDQIIRAEIRALNQLRRVASPFVQAGEAQLRDERRERNYERRWFEAETQLRIAIAEGHKQVEIDALAREVKSLRQKARGGPGVINAGIPAPGQVAEMARARIASMKVGQIKPEVFWATARRASKAAVAAAAQQNYDAAIVAKQQELLGLALYREAVRMRDEAEKRTKAAQRLDSPASRARIGLAGGTFQDQIDAILDRYEFARVTQAALDRRASLRKWIAAQEGEGLPVDLPEELVEETRRINYRELTVEELIGVTDGLQQIVHLAGLKNRLLKAKAARELSAVTSGLAASIRDKFTGTPAREGVIGDRRKGEETSRTIGEFFAEHRKLSSLLRQLDGWEDGGAATTAIMFTLNEAADTEAQMMADATKAVGELVDTAFPGAAKGTLYDLMEVRAVNKSLSRMQRLMVAFNWGNEQNRQRIRDGFGWTDQQVQAILDTLSAGDLTFVQGVLDHLDSYWPEIAAKQQRVYGVAPEKVEAMPITAANGTIRGGYFPLKYDDRLGAGAIKALDLEAANAAKFAAYNSATTRRGHTKGRLDVVKGQAVRSDFGVIFEHIGQVIHDLSHHEALLDVGRILGSREVQQAILETHGDIVYKQIRNAIRDVAFGGVPAQGGFERALNHVRQGATIVGLAWNFTTAMLQPLGLSNSMFQIGPKWVARGIMSWLGSPKAMVETVGWIEERSTFMKLRGQTQQREISEIRQQIGISTGTVSGWVDEVLSTVTNDLVTKHAIADSYFWAIQQMQRVADVPTWLGQYEKSMAAGETEERAIKLADQAVLDSQGGGQIKDLAQVQRGGPMMKLWTNFYSFFNVLHQQHMEALGRAQARDYDPHALGRLASDYLLLFILPATLGYFLRNALRPGDDKRKGSLLWALIGENASYLAGSMLGVREISGAIQGSYGYEGPAGARAFSAFSRLAQQVRQGEVDVAAWKALNDTAGILLHYPAGQVRRTLEGMAALAEGKTANPIALVTGAPKK